MGAGAAESYGIQNRIEMVDYLFDKWLADLELLEGSYE